MMETNMKPTGKPLKYQQLKQQLQRQIEEKQYPYGQCLPTERELCDMLDASRMTLRKAISELEDEGYLYRVQGKGTFVSYQEKLEQPLAKLTSFSDDMRLRGMKPGSRILLMEVIPAGERIAKKLNITADEQVIMFRRLRLADDEPMAIETSYFSYDRCHSIMEGVTNGMSLYTAMRDELGIVLRRAEQSIETGLLQLWEASMLGNEALTNCMFIKRLTFDENGDPIEYVESKYRADRYKFFVELYC